jgi:hypothetical protein
MGSHIGPSDLVETRSDVVERDAINVKWRNERQKGVVQSKHILSVTSATWHCVILQLEIVSLTFTNSLIVQWSENVFVFTARNPQWNKI